jgi:hypothetical protein
VNVSGERRTIGRGSVLAVAVLLVLASVAVAGVSSGKYSGTTAQTGEAAGQVHFTVSANKKAVHVFSGAVFASCEKSGSKLPLDVTLDPTPDMAIKKEAFGFHGNFNIDDGTVVIAKKVDGSIKGKFGAHSEASGTMSFKWKFDSNAPAEVRGAACTTGSVSFTAMPK